jgi:vitamin-K-epoxide reductase (warfarin-sensitive)
VLLDLPLRYVLILLAAAGLYVSARALQVHYSDKPQPCSINEVWDCGVVNHSKYAVVAGVPVAFIGIGGYLFLGVLGALRRFRLLAVAACAGLAFSVYLTYIEKYVLGVWCVYCVASLAIISLIVLFCVVQLAFSRARPLVTV